MAHQTLVQGRLELFRNYDEYGNPLARPNTLLIDSEQLESGDALDQNFRKMASDEIERFRREIIQRTGDQRQADNITDQDLLREVMNTVGKAGRLGESIRCVVSVSMLTEGWDANTVTHILGIRAFGTQLLCEQVVGRALRRQSYDLNEEGLFDVEYADILGIPFDFTAKPVISKPQPPRESVHVHAMRPERDALEIQFPRVEGYRVELPNVRLEAEFNADSTLELTPDLVGPSITKNAGIIGEDVDLNLKHLEDMRQSTLVVPSHHTAAVHPLPRPGQRPGTAFVRAAQAHHQAMAGQLSDLQRRDLPGAVDLPGAGGYGLLRASMPRSRAASWANSPSGPCWIRITRPAPACTSISTHPRASRWQTDSRKCQVNWVVLDSDWEGEFCRVVEAHPRVRAYVKNQGLGLEVPYRYGSNHAQIHP